MLEVFEAASTRGLGDGVGWRGWENHRNDLQLASAALAAHSGSGTFGTTTLSSLRRTPGGSVGDGAAASVPGRLVTDPFLDALMADTAFDLPGVHPPATHEVRSLTTSPPPACMVRAACRCNCCMHMT